MANSPSPLMGEGGGEGDISQSSIIPLFQHSKKGSFIRHALCVKHFSVKVLGM